MAKQVHYDFSGRTAIITGGAGGLGSGIARRMLDAGAQVELWDRSGVALDHALARLASPLCSTREVDITDEDAVGKAVISCHAVHGRIDVLVNNAGILGEVLPVWETDPRNVRQVLDTNLFGTYLVTRAVTNMMRQQTAQPMRGHIVNVSSIQGKEGMGLALAYSASKAGVMAMTKTVAKDTAKLGIMVTAITPAAAETAMAQEISQTRRDEITSKIPMGRFVEVDEIARMVMWLSSDDCSFSTGGIFDLSGGRATY
ncbi:MAG: SDR family oxidoreductase [Rhizobiales bacterium]|jgi:3-oxoacyl-[acyl-carrier protein] reductase|nr:SDR family oxidoreductase [Hyphomicrobiales bacterium]